MPLKKFNYFCPKTFKELKALCAKQKDFKLLAGGTWILNLLKKNNSNPKNIVSLKGIKELNKVDMHSGSIRIGAMANLDDLSRNILIKKKVPVLAECIKKIATPQIRNMATVGGNLCACLPWADLPCVFLALDAEPLFIKKGKVNFADFLKNPKSFVASDILKEIVIPKLNITKYKFLRLPLRNNTDIPFASLCLIKTKSESRFTVNLGNAYPSRFKKVEAYLNNHKSLEKSELSGIFDAELKSAQKDALRVSVISGLFKQFIEEYE